MISLSASDAAESLSIRLFGRFEIESGGKPLPPMRTQKGQWLLALLALNAGREVSRDRLIAMLWPDSSESQARANLRNTLYNLRQVLAVEAVRLVAPTPATLRFDFANVRCDLLAFDAAMARKDLAAFPAAVSLYRGALLEDCLENWAETERTAREQAYLQALEHLAEQAREAQEFSLEIEYLQRLLSVDPYREASLCALLEAFVARGDHSAVLVAYRDFRLLLMQELNAQPGAETTALFRRLRLQAQSVRRESEKSEAPPPKRARPSLPGNLPAPLSSLVGRKHEIESVVSLLARDRLITLSGAGGIGKTRLAIAGARAAAGDFPDGLWFVDLAPLNDPILLANALLNTLGLTEPQATSLLPLILDHLKTRQALLILDNCEHLLEEAARIAVLLLEQCPGVRILATSRGKLGIPGERVYPVPSLTLPVSAKSASFDTLLEYDALALFVERAFMAKADFHVTAGGVRSLASICHRLDGIPLAIELAAARVRVMSPEQIEARLDNRFRLLTGGSRAALPRHQTLKALIDWSYDLLDPQEKRMLQRLAVFAGSWTLEAAEQIVRDDERIESQDVLDLLTGLVDQSLVGVESAFEATRYRFLETVRQYAEERLTESGERSAMQARHLAWYVAFAEEVERKLYGAEQAQWLDALDHEHDNLRAALEYACGLSEDAEDSWLRLTAGLWRFWQMRGHLREGIDWLERALARNTERTVVRANALNGLGSLAWVQGNYGAAWSHYEESLLIYRLLGIERGVASVINNLGLLAREQGDYAAAYALFSEGLEQCRRRSDPVRTAMLLCNLGIVAKEQGEYDRATEFYTEALGLSRQSGDVRLVAMLLLNLGNIAKDRDDLSGALSLYNESAAMARELGDQATLLMILQNLADLECRRKNYAEARRHLGECVDLLRRDDDPRSRACVLEIGGVLALGERRPERAARLFGAAEALRRALGVPLPPDDQSAYDVIVAEACASTDARIWRSAWAAGPLLSAEAGLAYVLD